MDKPTLTFGSLFAGIGGIDLGLERAGMQCAWQVEIDDYAQKVLAKHWPNVARFRDVRSIGRHIGDIHTCYIPVTDINALVGGFPCQPHSNAGERKASQDERDLWPEFYRIIRELEPRWVVAENVLGLLSSEDGAFFGGVLRDLAEAGYDARWQVLSAAQFGAPHLRERVIVVAYHTGVGSGAWRAESARQQRQTITNRNGAPVMAHADSDNGRRAQRAVAGGMAGASRENAERKGYSQRDADQCGGSPLAHASSPEWWASAEGWRHVADWTDTGWQEAPGGFEFCGEELADASRQGLSKCGFSCGIPQEPDSGTSTSIERGSGTWANRDTWATQSRMGRDAHGIPAWLDGYQWPAGPGQEQYNWEAPRVTTEKVANRTARLKGLGNAVVPALAEYVGRCIVAAEAERQAVA